jgi:hypothetical protein
MHDTPTRLAYPFLDLLEAHVDALRDEALALDPSLWGPMPEYPGVLVYVLDAGPWKAGYPDLDAALNRARCPNTMAVVEQIAGVELAGFLCVPPGVSMAPHTDPRDDDVVRCHLALVLPPDEQAWWPEGHARLMDSRQLHSVQNDAPVPRYTFILDARMPFVVPENAWGPWRPTDPGPG